MKTETQNRMNEFLKSRDEALLSLDKEKILEHAQRFKVKMPDDEKVFWIAVHKARIAITYFPDSEKAISILWLTERGYRTEIFGDENGR
jgi:hypothetical protein